MTKLVTDAHSGARLASRVIRLAMPARRGKPRDSAVGGVSTIPALPHGTMIERMASTSPESKAASQGSP